MMYLKTSQLESGMVTASPLYDSNGVLMLSANSRLTRQLIRRLKSLRFHGIYVLGEGSENDYKPFLDDAFRQDAIRTLKSLDIDQIMYVANAISNQVIYESGMLYDMQNVCSYDSLTYMHCINVAVLSVMCGVSMGLCNADLVSLGQAALLHDIGKTRVDPKIIKGTHRLSPEERAEMQYHPKFGYDMLAGNPAVSEDVRLGVLYHHENENGSGYPCGIKSDEIPLFAKIIHVADVYDALVSKRSYKARMNPSDALENLMGGIGSQFDMACVEALRSSVALYPVGREVVLSDGLHAWVKENRKGYPTRPLVVTNSGLPIDLMKKLNVVITRFADEP